MLPAQARVTRQRVTQEPSTTESAEADAQGGQQDQRAKPSSSWIRSEPQITVALVVIALSSLCAADSLKEMSGKSAAPAAVTETN